MTKTKDRQFAVVEKQFQYKGHECTCVFTRNGYRCGYVSTTLYRDCSDFDIDCHWGLSFAGMLPREYAPKGAWYIGFDCGHCEDGIDTKSAYDYGLIDEATKERFDKSFWYLKDYPVKDVEYVVEQCKKIVDQLEALEKR